MSWQQTRRRSVDNIENAGNHVFSDVDIRAVRQSISENEKAIEVLQAGIEDHARAIRQIQYKIQGHLTEIRKSKGMITLARHLPPEILGSIFEECVNTGWTRTPLIVSQVCSSWRKAARIPTVWSHVYVNLDNNEYRRTCLWLERSQEVPLVIDLDINGDTPQIDRILTLLVSEARRWKEFNIKSAMLHPVNRVLQTCIRPVPQLQSISITVLQEFPIPNPADSEEGHHELFALRTAFPDATQLRRLRIDRNLLPGLNIVPSLITHLALVLSCYVLTTQSITSMSRLLENLPLLDCLSIEVPSGHRQTFNIDADQERVVELPHLTTLTLMGVNNIFALLAHLRSRNLTILRLRSYPEYNQAEVMMESWIADFLERSNPPLRMLELREITFDPSVYDRLLPFLATLEELRLHDSDLSDSTLMKLKGPGGQCPLLQFLDLRWCGRLSGRAIVELVRSGCMEVNEGSQITKPILEVAVINCSFVKEEDILDLSKLTTCRLIHKGPEDFCYSYGCCENQRYRKRLKQRLLFYLEGGRQGHHHIIL